MQRYAKWAVGRALASGGDETDARANLRKVDPLLRGRARRRLEDAIGRVWQRTPDLAPGPGLLAKVGAELGATPTRARSPFWWASLAALLSIVSLAAIIAQRVTFHQPASGPRFESLPERADAFENGGRPLSLGLFGVELFGEKFESFVIALDRHAAERTSITELDLDRAERELTDEKWRAHLGDKAHAALVGLAESARATIDDGEAVVGDADELNVALAAAGLGYYVDDSTRDLAKGTAAFFYTHEVERVRVFDVGSGKTERVLWLRRLDKLNRRKTLTGSTHQNAAFAVIRRELVEETVLESVPLLADGARFDLWPVAPSRPRPDVKKQLEILAGARVRAEFAASGIAAVDGSRLASLLEERADRMAELSSRARDGGLSLALPSGYLFDLSPYLKLKPVVGDWVLREIAKLNNELDKAENRAVYSKLRALYVDSVEFHEIQHRLDYARTASRPADVLGYLGVEDGAPLSAFASRLITEYSAYLASMANSVIPYWVLFELSRFAFDEANWDSTYADAAVLVVYSLCREAGIVHSDFVVRRRIDREALAAALVALSTRSSDELRAVAKAAWQSGFAVPLVVPRLR